MAEKKSTFEDIMRDIKKGNYKPIYFLMGDESYYIDKICNYIEENALKPEEKDFNLIVLYGRDTDVPSITNAAKRFPMMSERQVVIVKEAQTLQKIEELSHYVANPQQKTILVVCYKGGTLDRRKKLPGLVEKNGVLFESKSVKDYQLGGFITSYLKASKVDIEPKAVSMMAEAVGTDLGRMSGELDKLIITLPSGQTRVTPELVERNIGFSKDFNTFELNSALVNKDVYKANLIINNFANNPKAHPLQMTLAVMFNFFSNLMMAYYSPDKSERGIANFLGLRGDWQAKDYAIAMRQYTGVKVMHIIRAIRMADARSKGCLNVSVSDSEIMRELIFFILH